jgi:hypothetical protein
VVGGGTGERGRSEGDFFLWQGDRVLAIKLMVSEGGASEGGAIAREAGGTCPCRLLLLNSPRGVVTCHGLRMSPHLHLREEESGICHHHAGASGVGARASAGCNRGHDRHNGHAGTCGRREGGEDGGRQEQRLVGDLDLSRP